MMDAGNIVTYLASMGEHEMAQEVAAMNNRLEAFAAGLDRACLQTVVLAEREECAKVCDGFVGDLFYENRQAHNDMAGACAKAIRAR